MDKIRKKTMPKELEKEWLEKYGDLTKQFDELQKYKKKLAERIEKIEKRTLDISIITGAEHWVKLSEILKLLQK